MLDKCLLDTYQFDAAGLAREFSKQYFSSHERIFPINPFQVLSDLKVPFVFRNLDTLEGAFLAVEPHGEPFVLLNAKRPIQRIRFTAAHELCHFLKDSDNEHIPWCISGSRNRIEIYADKFSSAFLMPEDTLKQQLSLHYRGQAVTYDVVLKIAEYFGVSFEACLFRIAGLYDYVLPLNFRRTYKKYHPKKRREEFGLNDTSLLKDLINAWPDMWTGITLSNASFAYKSNFIFNDSRLENVDAKYGLVADMITDLRRKGKQSLFYHNTESPFFEIAGHSDVYDYVFDTTANTTISIYDTFHINRLLFSHAEFPDYGGRTRNMNTMVLGAKFETSDYHEIMNSLQNLAHDVDELDDGYPEMRNDEILHRVAIIHHKLTQIHPFPDGNGRTARAFMNRQLIKYGLCPVYITIEEKGMYFDALNKADKNNDVSFLESILIFNIFKTHADIYTVCCETKKLSDE